MNSTPLGICCERVAGPGSTVSRLCLSVSGASFSGMYGVLRLVNNLNNPEKAETQIIFPSSAGTGSQDVLELRAWGRPQCWCSCVGQEYPFPLPRL